MKRVSESLSGLIVLPLLALSPHGHAQDVRRGGLLYENHCNECHEHHVHQRGKSHLHTRGEVWKYVETWQKQLNLGWSGDDVADVVFYLNERYYRFPAQGE
ncbi:MAG: cytochrome C [Pseudomonadota bacterium]|nr:cytochrome C [Pseudomonadota bacterium]